MLTCRVSVMSVGPFVLSSTRKLCLYIRCSDYVARGDLQVEIARYVGKIFPCWTLIISQLLLRKLGASEIKEFMFHVK